MIGHQELIPLHVLRHNPVQPFDRTTGEALKTLKDEIYASKVITPLIVVANPDEGYTITDGHRRATIAAEMGLTEVPCLVLPVGTDPAVAFVTYNKAMRQISGRNWLTIYALNQATIGSFTPLMRSHIHILKSWIGIREVIRLGLEGKQAPSIVSHVTRILNTLNMFPSTAGQVTGGTAFYWLTKHAQQRVIVEVLKRDVTQAKVSKLLKAIQRDQALA